MSSENIVARIASSGQITFKGYRVNDQIICDKSLLSEKSLFFRYFLSSPLESGRDEFEIKDISFENLKRVVNFISTSEIDLDGDNLLELLSVSIYLAVPSLEELCKQNLIFHADPQDYCMIFKFANQNRLPDFSSQLLQLIHQHAADALAERSFVECDVDEMISIIESDDLAVEDEELCWHAIKAWYTHDATNRQSDFVRLLDLVRFPLMQEYALAAIGKSCEEHEFFGRTVRPFLKKTLEIQQDPRRGFEITHPKYHLRNSGFQHGLILFNNSEVTSVSFEPAEGHGSKCYSWRSDIVVDLVGLFDPATQQTKWLHEVPKNVRPGFACQSQTGDLFISTSSYNPYVSEDRVLKYCLERDSWDVVIEAGLGYVKGMCVLDHTLYVFCVGKNFGPPTFMTRRVISISSSPEVPDSDETLPFHFTYGTCCLVQGGCIYVLGCGAYDTPDCVARQVFCFEPHTRTWSRKTDSPIDIFLGDQVCAHSDGLIYTMTVKCESGRYLSHLWSYDPVRNVWNIVPVLARTSIMRPLGIYTWNEKLLFKDRFYWNERRRDYDLLRETPAVLVVSCHHDVIWMYCRTCRKSMTAIEVYDTATKRTVNSWVLGSRETGESECGSGGTAYRIRKSALRDRKDEVRAVKVGNEPGVATSLEECKQQLRINPPVYNGFDGFFNI